MQNFSIPVITGPTGSGKSDLVYSIVDSGFNVEIITADAFQVYDMLNIGTAKPDKLVQKRIKHHLIDVVPVDGTYTTGDFVEHAEDAIGDILQRGAIPIIAGGTGLYIQSLRDGICNTPQTDEKLRELLKQRGITEGATELYKEFAAIDPEAASRVHENDLVRTIRGLEVWYTTGLPISKARKVFQKPPKYKYDIYILERDRVELYADIDQRVQKMLDNGWLLEVKSILAKGYNSSMPSFRAIGYRELADVVNGVVTLPDVLPLIAQQTRNYAKRQLTWFRGMDDVNRLRSADIYNQLTTLLRGLK